MTTCLYPRYVPVAVNQHVANTAQRTGRTVRALRPLTASNGAIRPLITHVSGGRFLMPQIVVEHALSGMASLH